MQGKTGFKHRLFAQTARFLQLHPQVQHLAVVVVVPHLRLKLGPAQLPQQLQGFLDGVIWLGLEELGQRFVQLHPEVQHLVRQFTGRPRHGGRPLPPGPTVGRLPAGKSRGGRPPGSARGLPCWQLGPCPAAVGRRTCTPGPGGRHRCAWPPAGSACAVPWRLRE